MLQKIRMITGFILIILIIMFLFGMIVLITKEDPKVNDPLPIMTKQEQKILTEEIETQTLPMPGINE